jgi:nucleotide-binding universal stress UspA family protein
MPLSHRAVAGQIPRRRQTIWPFAAASGRDIVGCMTEASPSAGPMRVLLPVDGSPCSDLAVTLAASVPWPAGSVLRVVTAFLAAPEVALAGSGFQVGGRDLKEALVAEIQVSLRRATDRLPARAYEVQGELIHGFPADAVIEEAQRFEADLIIAGSRGHGPLATLLLGSVSAALVDGAPCPVLVARRPSVRRAIVAIDGSPAASRALELAVQSHLLDDAEVAVVGVIKPPTFWYAGVAPAAHLRLAEEQAEMHEQLAAYHRHHAELADARLGRAGIRSRVVVPAGDPASEILRLGREAETDLIVLGSRGHTGVSRIVLGSVARNVLLHADASVLVVRPDSRRT